MKLKSARYVVLALMMMVMGQALAEPEKLSNTVLPAVVAKGVGAAEFQNAVAALMMPKGLTPVRQGRGTLVYEVPLSFWQAMAATTFNGAGSNTQAVGLQTFTFQQSGPDVMATAKFESVATRGGGYYSNPMPVDNASTYNEMYVMLQLAAATAEGRYTPGPHNMLGIKAYKKPTRKTKAVGIVIETLQPGGAAEKAGLVPGDVITHIGGVPTAEQSLDMIGMLGFLQFERAVLQVQGKGEVVVVKAAKPTPPEVKVQMHSTTEQPEKPKTLPSRIQTI